MKSNLLSDLCRLYLKKYMIFRIRVKVHSVFGIKPSEIDAWLQEPLLLLDNKSCQYWINKGRGKFVLDMLEQIENTKG